MKYFLEFVAGALAEYASEVDVEQVEEPNTTIFYVHVHPADIGKLIGKHGRTISAMRAVLNAASKDKRIRVEIVENIPAPVV
ncbi:MAG: KH domain-containing protein [bacterium]